MKRIAFVSALLFGFGTGFGQPASPVLLYPDKVPNSRPAPADYAEKNSNGWITKVAAPSLTPYFPTGPKKTGTAVIVIPGGAYAGIAYNHEGADVAKRFADSGITAFLLKYRLPSDLIMVDRSIGPLQDAQRAVQLVRQRAAEWKIDTGKIGVIGFSAGGHLASTLGTHYKQALIENGAGINLRPSFMALIYPVISMGEFTHQGSKQNLIGQNASPDKVLLYSNERQVDAATPPAFLVHAEDDSVVAVQNAVLLYSAFVKAKAKIEMHLYPSGGHGFGLNNKTTGDQWFDRCVNWLRSTGLAVYQ